jgi:hypothetical protein
MYSSIPPPSFLIPLCRYNKICGEVTKLTAKLKELDSTDPYRIEMTEKLLDKLYNMGLIPTKKSLVQCEKIAASSLCRSEWHLNSPTIARFVIVVCLLLIIGSTSLGARTNNSIWLHTLSVLLDS